MSVSPRKSGNPERVLRRLEWTVIRRLDGMLHGDYRTLFRGNGLDLADLRAVTFQSMCRTSSWYWYSRRSARSMPGPRNSVR